jgi:phospholipid/cholesterol/gamma-HCH transport system substrate-binding protein
MRTVGYEKRVGIFVVIATVLGSVSAFVIGAQRNVFESKVEFRTVFTDAEGIRPGSPVRVGGVTVGSVTEVEFRRDGKIDIVFSVTQSTRRLVRGNPARMPENDTEGPQPSRVSVGSKGMLGDKLIEVSIGSMSLPEWPEGTPLPNAGGEGLMELAERTMSAVEGTATNLEEATNQLLADDQFMRDVRRISSNLASISTDMSQGDGTVGRLLRDPQMADEFEQSLANLRTTSNELAQTSRSIRQITDEVRGGDGSAHRLIYGPEAANAAQRIGDASGELAQALEAIRTGNGTMHTLIYGNEADELLANLTEASGDLAEVMEHIRQGRGTIGGLLVDPSIYEDVKRLVGDLQRNDILRSLVRYSIRRDGATERTDVTPVVEEELPPPVSPTP